MNSAPFISADSAALAVWRALDQGNHEHADRWLTEAIGRLLTADLAVPIPDDITAEPSSIGDPPYDTLLATAFAFAMTRRGQEPLPWMVAPPALSAPWLLDGGYNAGAEFTEFIRAQTPEIFLAKNILLRERDFYAP